jgi:DNA polymerase theta
MFEWQAECLSLHGVLLGRSIIYSAPTSAGKTLVAELLSLKCILEHRKKVVMVLPFVSIVHEKTNYFRGMFEEVGVKIGGFAGNQSPQGGLSGVDMAICTIEKANSLINHTLEENKLDQIGMIVIDELHMIGDNNRGYLIELLLTKLRHVCKIKNDDNNGGLQLVGMSATLPNLNTLGRWLDALVYTTDYRPVPLKEMVKIGNSLYDDKFVILSELQNCTNDEDYLHKACSDKISKGQSVLIFCPTKIWCEKLSCAIAKIFSNSPELFLDSQAGLNSLCEQLRRTQVGLDPTLAKVIPMGVAYHHAGLTFDEREIIEGGFRHSLIRVLIATSTLSSGVNLPARLVIIRTPTFNQSIMDPFVYRQMIGRAGRKGIDEEGESVLMCKPSERAKVVSLLNSAPKDVKSCLYNFTLSGSCTDTKALNRAILEVVVNNAVSLYKDIVLYISCTLLGTQLADSVTDTKDVEEKINFLSETSLNFLLEHNFVLKRKEDSNKLLEEYCATQLGMATVSSFLSPNEALIILDEFMKARKSLVLENELHLIYLVTPVSVVNQWPCIDWYNYLCIWERLTPDMKHVADVVGVEQSFIVRAVQRKPLEKTEIQKRKLLIHKRFYTSLTLNDLIKELPVNAVAKQYGASKGLLQSLQSAAGSFAGMVTVFCNVQ